MHALTTAPSLARFRALPGLLALGPPTTRAAWLGRRRIEARRLRARPAVCDLRGLNDHLLRDVGLL